MTEPAPASGRGDRLAAGAALTENEGIALEGEGASLPEDERPERDGTHADERPVEDGSSVVLQALMSMLGEVLGRLDHRLDGVEQALAEVDAGAGSRSATGDGEEMARVLVTLERVADRLERLERLETAGAGEVDDEMTALGMTLERMADRLERLEAAGADAHRNETTTVLDSLAGLVERVGELERRSASAATLATALERLEELSGAVDTIGYGLASLADVMTSPERQEWTEGVQAALMTLGADVSELRRSSPSRAPVEELQVAVGRLEDDVRDLMDQPGPGPALAMVAAGLAQRFEERTEALTELLEANAAYVRRFWERIEDLLDGGGFDELAVGAALEHMIDNQEQLADSLQRALASGESQAEPAGAAAPPLETLEIRVEEMGAGIDDVRRPLASIATSVEAMHVGWEAAVEASTASFGRRASQAGRRLALDLGRRGREIESRPSDDRQGGPGP